MNPSILAVIVAYNPDLDLLRDNIAAFADVVDRILLWQNSPVAFEHPKAVLCGDGSNQGIPAALNYAWHYAEEHGFDYLLTMDQDSIWHGFQDFVRTATASSTPEGIYVPCINEDASTGIFLPADDVITSGMFLPVGLIGRIGGWRNDFLVEAVDIDFQIRAQMAGIPFFKIPAGHLSQTFAKRHIASRFGLHFHVYDYPLSRLYEIYRNHWIVIRSYPGRTKTLRRRFIRNFYLHRIPRILLGEKDRFRKLRAIAAGTRAGLRYETVSAPAATRP